MSCTRPRKAIKSAYGNGYTFLSKLDEKKYSCGIDKSTGEFFDIISIPCGKCPSCLNDKAREWAARLELESSLYPDNMNYFVTLTYNNDSIPVANNGSYTLRKHDVSAFMKRLRKRMSDLGLQTEKIRFFACGEYGEKSYRPHYHLLLFNCNLSSTLRVHERKNGYTYYRSSVIESCWKFGNSIVCNMTSADIRYTARYTLKKAGGRDKSAYEALGIAPEFTLMSRRPGIGYGADIDNALNSSLILQNGEVAPIPKYLLDKSANVLGVSKYKVLRQYKGYLRSGGKELSDEELLSLERKKRVELNTKKSFRKEI